MPPSLFDLTLGVFKDDLFAALYEDIDVSDHPHPRARIREWALARLRAAALEPERIQKSRGIPEGMQNLPRIFLYTLRETSEVWNDGPTEIQRTCTLAVHPVIAEASLPEDWAIDDIVDGMAHVVETLLLNDRGPDGALGGQAQSCELIATDIATKKEGDRLVFHARIDFTVKYLSEVAEPTEEPLERIHVRTDLVPLMSSGDLEIEAEDRIELPRFGAGLGVVTVTGTGSGTFG